MAAPGKQPAISELQPDLGTLERELTTPPPPEPDDIAELARLLSNFAAKGTLLQAPDGSFRLPNHVDPRQQQIDQMGSDCPCPRCTPHNQLHWFCAGCYSGPHDWATRRPQPDTITILQHAGIQGKSWRFCAASCGLAYRQRQGMTPGILPNGQQGPSALGAGDLNKIPTVE